MSQTRQTMGEMVKNLATIAESKEIKLSDHVRASLWCAIDVVETIKAESQRIDKRLSVMLEPF